MNNLLIQKQDIEFRLNAYKEVITEKEKENAISISKSYLEDLKGELEILNNGESHIMGELTDIDLEIEEWTEDNEQDLNEDIRNQSNPN